MCASSLFPFFSFLSHLTFTNNNDGQQHLVLHSVDQNQARHLCLSTYTIRRIGAVENTSPRLPVSAKG
jgi:hypothetical protein